jgi:hypothetical protein
MPEETVTNSHFSAPAAFQDLLFVNTTDETLIGFCGIILP